MRNSPVLIDRFPSPAARARRRAGLTLLECLVALGLLAVVGVLGLEALRSCRNLSLRAGILDALSARAEQALSEAAVQPFDSLASGTLVQEIRIPRAIEGDLPAPLNARLTRRVTPLDERLKEIRVELSCATEKGPAKVTLQTRIAGAPQQPKEGVAP